MCDNNIDLIELLGKCPANTKFYSPLLGEVELIGLVGNSNFPICIEGNDETVYLTREGKYFDGIGECMIFPSKDNHDWSTFRPDLPIDTIVVVSNSHRAGSFTSGLSIRRYAGNGKCFLDNESSKTSDGETMAWDIILPIDKFTAREDGLVLFSKIDNYGRRD